MLRRPAAAEAWYASLKVGDRYALEYAGDTVAHERRALWPCEGSVWVGLTPDGGIYAEDVSCSDARTGPNKGYRLGPGVRVVGGRLPLYSFAAEPTREEMKKHVKAGREEAGGNARAAVPQKIMFEGAEESLEAFLAAGAVLPVAAARPAGAAAPAAAASPAPPAGKVWKTEKDGKEVDQSKAALVTPDGLAGLVLLDGRWEVFRAMAPGEVPAVGPSVDKLLQLPDATRAGREEAPQDVRVLDVCWDEQGGRYREWRTATAESSQEHFTDAPTEGPPTALHMAKVMQRVGDPKLWLERFLREKNLSASDRTTHELRTLCDALWSAGSYDQLNLGALSTLEIISRRVAVIVEAYQDPAKPNWATARYY